MTLLDEAWDYFWYAERWHWTPQQVDEVPAWLDSRLGLIAQEYDKAQDRAHKKAMSETGG